MDGVWAYLVDEDCEPRTGIAHFWVGEESENHPDIEHRTPLCGQTAEDYFYDEVESKTCSHCNGTGIVGMYFPCDACEGRGTLPIKCRKCLKKEQSCGKSQS